MRRVIAAAAILLGASCAQAGSYITKSVQDGTGVRVQSFFDESGNGSGPFDPVYSLPPGVTVGGGTGGSSGAAGWGGASSTGAYKTIPLPGGSAQGIFTAGTRTFLDLSAQNSANTDIWCAFGETAQVNAGNSFRIAAGADARWENSFAPADAVSCIASANTTLFAGAH